MSEDRAEPERSADEAFSEMRELISRETARALAFADQLATAIPQETDPATREALQDRNAQALADATAAAGDSAFTAAQKLLTELRAGLEADEEDPDAVTRRMAAALAELNAAQDAAIARLLETLRREGRGADQEASAAESSRDA